MVSDLLGLPELVREAPPKDLIGGSEAVLQWRERILQENQLAREAANRMEKTARRAFMRSAAGKVASLTLDRLKMIFDNLILVQVGSFMQEVMHNRTFKEYVEWLSEP